MNDFQRERLVNNLRESTNLHAIAADAIEWLAESDPRFIVTEVEGKCYVTVRGTDYVVAGFELPLKMPPIVPGTGRLE